jgi:hypothetical protein
LLDEGNVVVGERIVEELSEARHVLRAAWFAFGVVSDFQHGVQSRTRPVHEPAVELLGIEAVSARTQVRLFVVRKTTGRASRCPPRA